MLVFRKILGTYSSYKLNDFVKEENFQQKVRFRVTGQHVKIAVKRNLKHSVLEPQVVKYD